MKKETVRVAEKYLLTIEEASEYFNIGESKLRTFISLSRDADFIIRNGNKILIKRVKFEKMIDDSYSI